MSAEHSEKPVPLPTTFDKSVDRRFILRGGALGLLAVGGFASLNGALSVQRLRTEDQAQREVQQQLTTYSEQSNIPNTSPEYQQVEETLYEAHKEELANAEINAIVSIPVATASVIGGAILFFKSRGHRLDEEKA
jgi:hypothetical protein